MCLVIKDIFTCVIEMKSQGSAIPYKIRINEHNYNFMSSSSKYNVISFL